jgi:cytochrome c oxidase assembly protein subunit 15
VTAARLTFNINLFLHLANAILLTLSVVLVSRLLRRIQADRALRRPSLLLLALCLVQLGFGSATWIVKYGWPYWFADFHFAAAHTIHAKSWWQATTATLHMAVGSLILGTTICLATRVFRVLRVESRKSQPEVVMAGSVS